MIGEVDVAYTPAAGDDGFVYDIWFKVRQGNEVLSSNH